MKKLLLSTLMFLGMSADGADAQISITSLPFTPATTTFNSYDPSSSANLTSTIPTGWSANSSGTASYRGTGTGTSNAGGYWAYGSSGDYSLGVLHSASTAEITYSVSFTNNSGTTIQSLTLSWDYEQWRFANASGWDCSGTGQLAGNTTLNAKDFAGSSSGVNGTVATTQVASFNLTGLSITNGQSFGISWVTTDDASSDNGISIDNFSISASSGAPLPIELLSFSVKRSPTTDRLNWSTSCESSVTQFLVQRSDGYSDFSTQATVDAQVDNCRDARHYQYELPVHNAPISLYRLALRELSGMLSYSQTIRVGKANQATPVWIWPVPVRSQLHVEGAADGTPWRICNLMGQSVQQGVFSNVAIDLGSLPHGVYFLHHAAGVLRFEKE